MKLLPTLHTLSSRQSPSPSTAHYHDSSQANSYYIVAGICTGLMVIFVVLRLYIRFRITYNPWWDDGALVIALLSQTAYTGVIWRSGTVGLGSHISDVSMEQLAEFFELSIPSAILTAPAIYFTKLALLLFYLRLFSQNRPVKIGIWAGITVCTVFYTAVMFLYIFTGQDAQLKVTYAVASAGVITDIYIICLPLFAIGQLHLSRAKKLRVAAVFLTGLLAVVMSFFGCVYRFQLDVSDFTYSLLAIYIVNTVEVDIGIICCCLPLMAALFKNTKKESWWLTSLRRALNYSWLGSGGTSRSNGSNRTGYKPYKEASGGSLGDNIDLVELNGVAAEGTAMAGPSKSSVTKPAAVVPAPGEEGIWRETHIQQEWTKTVHTQV